MPSVSLSFDVFFRMCGRRRQQVIKNQNIKFTYQCKNRQPFVVIEYRRLLIYVEFTRFGKLQLVLVRQDSKFNFKYLHQIFEAGSGKVEEDYD